MKNKHDEQASQIALLIQLGRDHQEALELVAKTLKEHQRTLKMLVAAIEQMTEARDNE